MFVERKVRSENETLHYVYGFWCVQLSENNYSYIQGVQQLSRQKETTSASRDNFRSIEPKGITLKAVFDLIFPKHAGINIYMTFLVLWCI